MSGPEFGPGGYLPPKASKRARKIVLREQMGFGWPLAAVAAALLVAIAGGTYLYVSNQTPGPPFEAFGSVDQIEQGGAGTVRGILVVRAGGAVRAFTDEPDGIGWCEASQRLETSDAVWTVDGRLVGGQGASLQPLRSVVFDGVLYVDTSTSLPVPAPGPGGSAPVCAQAD